MLRALRTWLTASRHEKVQRYLRANPEALSALVRDDAVLYATAYNQAVMEASEDVHRKTMDYPILNQLGHGGRQTLGQTLPKVSPFNLRKFSEYPPARRAINALCNPILDMPWVIEPIPEQQIGTQRISDIEPTPEQQVHVTIAEQVLRHPNDDDSWRVLLEQVLEDLVVGGYGAMEVQASGDPIRPVWLFPVDGQSVRINVQWAKDKATFRYTQSLGYVGQSVGTQDVIKLDDDELIYMRLNPRTNTPFGLGYLETAFLAVNAWLGSFEYAERRASNMTPNFGIFLGENLDIATVRRWQQYWEQEIEGYGKVPILGGGKQPQVWNMQGTGQDQLFLAWQEHLIRIIAMAFGVSPMKLGLERDVNRSTAHTQAANDWETIAPVANVVQDHLTRRLLWKRLGFHDLRFRWIVRTQDEERQSDILYRRWEMNSITVNEIREMYEQPPMPTAFGTMTRAEVEAYIQGMQQGALGGLPGGPAWGEPGFAEDEQDGQDEAPPIEERPELLDRAHRLLDAYDDDLERAVLGRVAT
jgi:hypothetical protein